MARITENYDDFTKEELLAECAFRGIEGVNSSTLKADIVAALDLNDEQRNESGVTDEPETTAPLPAPGKSNIPHVEIPKVVDKAQPTFTDDDFTGGMFVMRHYIARMDSEGNEKRETTLYPGELFALCKHDPDTYGRTHSLKNTVHFWQGSEAQFQATFEKK